MVEQRSGLKHQCSASIYRYGRATAVIKHAVRRYVKVRNVAISQTKLRSFRHDPASDCSRKRLKNGDNPWILNFAPPHLNGWRNNLLLWKRSKPSSQWLYPGFHSSQLSLSVGADHVTSHKMRETTCDFTARSWSARVSDEAFMCFRGMHYEVPFMKMCLLQDYSSRNFDKIDTLNHRPNES